MLFHTELIGFSPGEVPILQRELCGKSLLEPRHDPLSIRAPFAAILTSQGVDSLFRGQEACDAEREQMQLGLESGRVELQLARRRASPRRVKGAMFLLERIAQRLFLEAPRNRLAGRGHVPGL